MFDVSVETAGLRAVDVWSEAGGARPLTRTLEVVVGDGQLDIGFRARVQQPMVSGIEVIPA